MSQRPEGIAEYPLGSTLSVAWTHFERTVIPASAPKIQRAEMRRAWYAGVEWFLRTLTASLDPEAEPTTNDLEYLDGIDAELRDFAEKIQRGLA